MTYGINDLGRIVSNVQSSNTDHTAWILNAHQRVNLNTLAVRPNGWQITEARAINNCNQMAATGYARGKAEALLLSPR